MDAAKQMQRGDPPQASPHDELARAEHALSFIPADDREVWYRVALAMQSQFGDAGFSTWDAWSQQSDSYRERDSREVWRSCRTPRGVTIATLYHYARQHGWSPRAADRGFRPVLHLPRKPAEPEAIKWNDRDQRQWDSAVPIRGTVAETYLQSRVCAIPPSDGHLRFLPRATYWNRDDERAGEIFPAMLALLSDAMTGEPLGLHFTWLLHDGSDKADVDKPKMIGHDLAGRPGVIRLWPDEDVTTRLTVSEGIETALTAAHSLPPAWATYSAALLSTFPVLAGVESLLIVSDNDPAGQRSAKSCAARWHAEGREVSIYTPEQQSDLNDELREVAHG